MAGLGFQLVDDVLDAESNTATLGKTAGKDASDNKPTYVSVLGVEQSRTLVAEMYDESLAVLDSLPQGGARLREIARFIFHREF
jgi:farnesyl diphosphate synthase